MRKLLFGMVASLVCMHCSAMYQAISEKKFLEVRELLEQGDVLQSKSALSKTLLNCVCLDDRGARFLTLFVLNHLPYGYFERDDIKKLLLQRLEKDFDDATFAIAAPDGSKICPFGDITSDKGASAIYAMMGNENISYAVRHRTYTEVWMVIAGQGEMMLKNGGASTSITLEPGVSVDILVEKDFQFRNTNKKNPLKIVVLTTPPWEGEEDVEFRKPIYSDSTYTHPKQLAQDLADRNTLREIFTKGHKALADALQELKKTWRLEKDEDCFVRIKKNTQNPLEHTAQMVYFYRVLKTLRKNAPSGWFLSSGADVQMTDVIQECVKNKKSDGSLSDLVASIMKKLGFSDKVMFYERWHERIEKLLSKKQIPVEKRDSIFSQLVQKMNQVGDSAGTGMEKVAKSL